MWTLAPSIFSSRLSVSLFIWIVWLSLQCQNSWDSQVEWDCAMNCLSERDSKEGFGMEILTKGQVREWLGITYYFDISASYISFDSFFQFLPSEGRIEMPFFPETLFWFSSTQIFLNKIRCVDSFFQAVRFYCFFWGYFFPTDTLLWGWLYRNLVLSAYLTCFLFSFIAKTGLLKFLNNTTFYWKNIVFYMKNKRQ